MDTTRLDIGSGVIITLSSVDYERVNQYKWHIWNGYPFSNELRCYLHHFVSGPRPRDVPEDYVLDHANRNEHDVSQPNLRWVSRSFNSWNRKHKSTEGYLGVRWNSLINKWTARFKGQHPGCFAEARDGFSAYAWAAVHEWPLWAPTSDILVGDGLLTFKEMDEITTRAVPAPTPVRVLPDGEPRVQSACCGLLNRSSHISTATHCCSPSCRGYAWRRNSKLWCGAGKIQGIWTELRQIDLDYHNGLVCQ